MVNPVIKVLVGSSLRNTYLFLSLVEAILGKIKLRRVRDND